MKISKFALLVFVLATAVIITACTGQTTSTQSTVKEPVTAETCTTQTAGATNATVDALIHDRLQNHHAIDRVYNAHHTREEWNVTLDRMIGYGAKISDSEKQIIIDYLLCRQQ
jgi:ABC-type glycerol-3-phosphate transport system substrate-binding protein